MVLVLDVRRHEAMRGKKSVVLAKREFEILAFLVRADRRPVPLDELCLKLYDDPDAVYSEAARQNLYRLSWKIPGHIVNIPRVGFKAINCRIGKFK